MLPWVPALPPFGASSPSLPPPIPQSPESGSGSGSPLPAPGSSSARVSTRHPQSSHPSPLTSRVQSTGRGSEDGTLGSLWPVPLPSVAPKSFGDNLSADHYPLFFPKCRTQRSCHDALWITKFRPRM